MNNGRWQEPVVWQADPQRFPHGLRAITDHAHAMGIKSVVWFEPERVMPSNLLYTAHPEWLLANHISTRLSKLFYLGNPAALAWLTDLVDRTHHHGGHRCLPARFQCARAVGDLAQLTTPATVRASRKTTTSSDISPITTRIQRRHPGLIIDSCAGGGSRIDLESMRRALPFWRSDYCFDVVSNQCQTYGLSLWVPYFGTATGPRQFSTLRAAQQLACPLVTGAWDMRDRTLPYDDLRRAISEWRDYAENYSGDFYPLRPASLGADVWLAWQFDRPGSGARRGASRSAAKAAFTRRRG